MERTIIDKSILPHPRRFLPLWAQSFYTSMTKMEKLTISLLVLLLITSATVSIVNIIRKNTHLIPEPGGVYNEAAVGQPRYINPVLAGANDLDLDITRLIYTGLFRFNGNLDIENDLATDVQISEDNKTYTISLRRDVLWHDGESFNADDVIFTIRSIQTPDYNSPLATSFASVAVNKIDDYTVEFILAEPYAPFLTSLTAGIVPEHVWSQVEPQNAALAEQILKPIGTGPFQFSEITTRRKTGDITNFQLVRNDNYYGPAPYLDAINLSFYATYDEALQALAANKVNGIGFLPFQFLAQAADQRGTEVHRLLLPQYFAVFFNSNKNEVLKDAGVRAALALATDRQEIVNKALNGEGETMYLAIPPGPLSRYEEFDPPTLNLKSARQNLDEGGWKVGEDGIRTKDDVRLSIKLTSTDWPEYVTTAQILKEQWQKIGVEVNLEHLGTGTIQQTVLQPRDYEALLFSEILLADPDPYPFWHSTQARSPGLNLSMFDNQEVDKLLETARKEPNFDKRAEMYRDFQNKIIELNPAIILYRPYYLFVTSGVRGINADQASIPAGRFNNVEQWHINTKRVRND